MKKVLLLIVFLLISVVGNEVYSQCAMCRAQLESNVSDGSFMLTSDNLNAGIMYLLAMPYVLIAVVAFFWYRNAKQNAQKFKSRLRYTAR
jgi:hypothetical protein